MKKSTINFIIDAIMFLLMALLVGIGLLIKYVLIPGQQRWMVYYENIDLRFLGLDRHQWGTIHLYVGITLVILLIFHIILHWNVILCLFKRLLKNKKKRIAATSFFVIVSLLLIVFPFTIKVEKNTPFTGKEKYTRQKDFHPSKHENYLSKGNEPNKFIDKTTQERKHLHHQHHTHTSPSWGL